MMILRFTGVDEFLEELREAQVVAGIVRLTNCFRSGRDLPGMSYLSVVAAFVDGRGWLTRLEQGVGTVFRDPGLGSEEVYEKAQAIHRQVEEWAGELGLRVKPGLLEKE